MVETLTAVLESPSAPAYNDEAYTGETWGGFRLLEKVGQGSFGEVYRAFDTTLEREVALKLLLPRLYDKGDDEKAILREARLIARVRHPNVVAVYGVDRFNGRVGFWSDFVHGQTLSALQAAQGRFGAHETTQIGIDICRAVSAVHAAGLLHRDIKTGNVMREDGGRILLMDFGLSHEHTQGESVAGTPAYMAPELFAGQSASVASDIYATGVLLFRLLTGRYPVEAPTLDAFRAAHRAGTRRLLYEERADLPEALARVIETSLSPDPSKRFRTAGQMIAALAESTGSSLASTAPEAAVRRRNFRPWMAIPVAAVLGAGVWFSPLPAIWRGHSAAPAGGANAHADYLKAQDLLDHYYRPNSIDQAIALFQKTVHDDPTFAPGYAGLGRALLWRYWATHDQNSIAPAKAACARAVELDRDIPSAHVTLGMIDTDAGRTDLAADEIEEALRLNARGADAWSALAELYQKEGRSAEIEPAIQKAVNLAPGAWRYLNQLGVYYMSVGKDSAAAEQYRHASTLNPDNATAFNNLGIAYLNLNRIKEAREAYEKSLKIAPAYNTLSNLGVILQLEDREPEAVEMFRRAVDLNPSSYVSWGNLATAQSRVASDKPQARATYLKAIELAEQAHANAPDDPLVVSNLGSYYASVEMREKSLPLLRQAAELAPENSRVLYRVAQGYELLHMRDDALKWIARALEAGFSRRTVERNPELAGLRSDPRFPRKQGNK